MKPVYIKINELGNKFYYADKEMTILHREDGPAVECADGYKAWWINNKRHREDGPAVEYCGHKEWYLNGFNFTEKEWRTKLCIGKVIEVDGKKYKLTAI